MHRQYITRTVQSHSTSLPTTTDWRQRAACRNEDPDLFFPVGTTGPALLQIEEARSACRRCPVMETCLTWALKTGQEHGVWGGTDPEERRQMKRRTARRAAAAARDGA